MSKKIGKRAVESKIKSAFYNASDDIDSRILRSAMLSLSDAPSIGKDKVRVMTERKNHTSIFKTVAIAAAIILILSITVTATSLSGLSSRDDALSAAITYMVQNETDAVQKNALADAVFFGDVSFEGISDGIAKLGLSEGRLVYYVSFYAAGYKYNCTIDAKSLVVFEGSKSYEPDYVPKNKWTPKRNNSLVNSKDQTANQHKISQKNAENIFTDNFGLHYAFIVNRADRNDRGVIITDIGDGQYYAARKCDGYSYSCNIDCETGEVSNSNVVPIENYKGEAVLHEKIEGLMTIEEATKLAIDISNAEKERFPAYLYKDDDGDYFYTLVTVTSEGLECDIRINGITGEVIENFEHINSEVAGKIAVEKIGEEKVRNYQGGHYAYSADSEWNITGVDEYHVELTNPGTEGTEYHVILDAHTGEVLSLTSREASSKPDMESEPDMEKKYKEITNKVEGVISKSTAVAIALENSGLTIKETTNGAPKAVLVDRDGSMVYIVKWQTHFGGGTPFTYCECVIDGLSGEIISSTPEVIRPDIEAESSNGSYIGKKAAEDALVEDLMQDSKSVTIISNNIEQYCVSASMESVEFRAAYVISFDRNRVGADHEVAYVDALSGEVLNYQIWVSR